MRLGLALACAVSLCACATRPAPDLGPTYSRAALAAKSTAELAALFLEPADAATIERHWIDEPMSGSWNIRFRARPRPIGKDICERNIYSMLFFPARRTKTGAGADNGETPVHAAKVYRFSQLALAPGCADLPGRRFAQLEWFWGRSLTVEEGVDILRSLASARDAAAAPGPLPFRLRCENLSERGGFECPADIRALLASLPLHQAFTIARNPSPHNCDLSTRDEADAVEIGDPDSSDVWDVRLRHMDMDEAEVVLIRQFPRTRVKC